MRRGGLVGVGPGWWYLVDGRAWLPGTQFGPLRMFAGCPVGAGIGVAFAGADGRGVTGQKRMVAGPGWRVLAGWPGFLTGKLLCRARLTARGQLRSRRCGLGRAAISARTCGIAVSQSSGGKSRRPGGGTADQSQRAGIADPVGIHIGGLGGAGDQHREGVVHTQPGPDLLTGQVRQP
jgi:hypothetical protein